MKHSRSVAVVVLLLAWAASPHAEPPYHVAPIVTPAGWTQISIGLNNLGQAVGAGYSQDGVWHYFIATTSGSTLMPAPEGWRGPWSVGGLNDAGEVSGWGVDERGISRPFIGSTSGSIPVPTPDWWFVWEWVGSINNSGQVSGMAWMGPTYQVFIASASGAAPVPLPPGWGSAARGGINDLGQVTGNNGSVSFIGTTSESIALPLPTGMLFAWGQGINNLGEVSGYGQDVNGTWRAFVQSTTESIVLPMIPGWSSMTAGRGINDSSQVVGGGSGGAFIWDRANGSRAIADLVPPEWSISSAEFINNEGQILAAGSNALTGYSGWVLISQDATPPSVIVPAPMVVEATGPGGATVGFEVSATDPDDTAGPVTCDPAPGSLFAIGTTVVACSSTDTHQNTGTASFSVTVRDTTPPDLAVPAGVAAEATGPGGAVVSFSATATDLVSGAVTPTCAPAAGSTFPIGTTTVTCAATDARANTATRSFMVTVTRPVATDKDQCKNGGWTFHTRATGSFFKNQGDCVSYVNTGK